jgi:hypothetical protein
LFDFAFVEDDDLVGDFEGFFLVMGDEKACDVDLVVEFSEPRAQFISDACVERAEGLVEEENFWPGCECSGERDALALSAGKLGGESFAVTLELDEVEEFVDAVADFVFGEFLDFESEGDILADIHMTKERVVLKDESDAALLGWYVGGVFAGELDGAGIGAFETGDDAEDRAFSRA